MGTAAFMGEHETPSSLTSLRLQVLANGYHPVPITGPTMKTKSAGKRPIMTRWQERCASADVEEIKRWSKAEANCTNTGLLCGNIAGVDIDVCEVGLSDRIDRLAEAVLGPTPLHRIGRAPKRLRCYRVESPLAKIETDELFFADGSKAQIEVLGKGQQFVGYGIHPDTHQPYRWIGQAPHELPAAELPIVTEAALREFVAASEAILRAAGGRTEAEIKAEESPQAAPASDPRRDTRKQSSAAGAKPKSDFFKEVNAAALRDIGAWFPQIFPRARQEAGTGAWRVSSADLGRGLEEDISLHPSNGGRDFGTRKSCSPIDLAVEHGGAPDAASGALWLCEQLRINPADLGWKPKKERPKAQERTPSGLPVLEVLAGELHTLTSAAEAAIIKAGIPIFQRGADLVRPASCEVAAAHGRMTIAAGLVKLTTHGLIDVFSSAAEWERFDARAKGNVRTNPPKQVADILLSRQGQWKLPNIAGVVTVPTMRPDGSILTAPGYDPVTRLFHVADSNLKLHSVVMKPTREDAERALAFLCDLLAEFPFVDAEKGKIEKCVSGAVALSAMITPVVRGALSVAPAHAFRASAPGTGKSYLADTFSAITTGRPCPVISAASDEAELEKKITGLLLAGFPIISLDNVNGELGGDLLCQAIERPFVRIRPLGSSNIVEIESRSSIYCTGNQLRVRGDMTRRTLVCDLDAGMERPELRKFNGDPVATVMADRSKYVSACLVIVRAYLGAGSPNKATPIVSFGAWSDLVRSALLWLGCADPADSMEQARQDDPELGDLREMLANWQDALGSVPTTCRAAIEAAQERVPKTDDAGEYSPHAPLTEIRYPCFRDALIKIAGNHKGDIDPARLGRWLLSREGRIVGGLAHGAARFKRDGVTGGSARWKLERLPKTT